MTIYGHKYYINFIYILFKASGDIKLLDYDNNEDKSWMVYSDCESVRMRSNMFELEEADAWSWEFDSVTIGDTEYKGSLQIDKILSTNFTVTFQSDGFNMYGLNKGFWLYWSCTQWGEWVRSNDGTCRHVMKILPNWTSPNGIMTRGLLKYKLNETCSK